MDHFNKYDGWPYAKLPHAVLWDCRLTALEITMYALLSARSKRAIVLVETLSQIGEDIGLSHGETFQVLKRLADFRLIKIELVQGDQYRFWIVPLEQVYDKTGRKFQSVLLDANPQAAPVPAGPAPGLPVSQGQVGAPPFVPGQGGV